MREPIGEVSHNLAEMNAELPEALDKPIFMLYICRRINNKTIN